MKLVAEIGNNKAGRESVQHGIAVELGYDGYSVTEDLREYLKASGLHEGSSDEKLDEMGAVLAKVSGVVETRLLAKIFDNAAKGRWGLVVTDILEQKTVELIAHLQGTIVFVGNDPELGTPNDVDSSDDFDIQILGLNYMKGDIRDNLLEIPTFLDGLKKKSINEVIVIHQEMVSSLTRAGFSVLDQ